MSSNSVCNHTFDDIMINKLDSLIAFVRFFYHKYDYGKN